MVKNISLLGSTGSIGESALDVIGASGGRLKAVVLCAGTNAVRLAEQVRQHRPLLAVIADASREEELRRMLADLPVRIASGVAYGVVGQRNRDVLAEILKATPTLGEAAA